MRRPGDVVAGGILVLLGIGVAVRGLELQIGSALDPQPGFFPFIGGVLLVVLAAILAVQGFRGVSASGEGERDDLRKPLILVAALLVYAALLETVGYPITTVLLVLLVLRVLEARWVPGVIVSVLLSLGSYFLFVKLGVPLPPGRLFGS